MTVQDVLELHRAGWSRDEVLAMMQQDQPQQVPEQQVPEQQVQQVREQPMQEQPQPEQQVREQPMPEQQVQPQESETVQLLREMLGMIRGNNINTMGGETCSVDAAEILAANDYGCDKGGKT